MQTHRQINSIQLFRGLAALAVVAHHAVLSNSAFVSVMPNWVHATLGQGNYGVDFFFVLSGFIIFFIHQHDQTGYPAARWYVLKRFVRVYPVYWSVALPLAGTYFLLSGLLGATDRNISVFSSIVLLPANGVPVLSVAWTVIHEILFYLVFLTFFYRKQLLAQLLVGWAAVIILLNASSDVPAGVYNYLFSKLNLEFMLGILAAKCLHRVSSDKIAAALALAGIVIGFTSLYAINTGLPHQLRLLFAFGMALVIMGAVKLESTRNLRWLGLLLLLGNASYSIYLVHNPFLSISQRLLASLGVGWAVGLFVGIVLATVAGVVFHLVIEKQLLQFCRTHINVTHRSATTRVSI